MSGDAQRLLENHGVDIISIDAKDIYISNHYLDSPVEPSAARTGYEIRREDGSIRTGKFSATMDYSLDLIKLREVYKSVYHNMRFSWSEGIHEYTQQVINVTFEYAVQEWNKAKRNVYVKFGYRYSDLVFDDCIARANGEIVGVMTERTVTNPVEVESLPEYFLLNANDERCFYSVKTNARTLQTLAALRNELYENGFWCDGRHYVRWKRSSGSSRVGKCLFIVEPLYRKMHRWEMCDLKISKGQAVDLASLEAYIALTLSSIVDTLEISPQNILVVDDYESMFMDRVVATELDGGHLTTSEKDVKISNSIWDGMSLIDTSIMGPHKNYGMVLLRNRFFKTCAFNTRIHDWMRDHNITEVSQLNGFTLASTVDDIKLITTPSSIKYLKFGSLEQWMDSLDPMFGVVKHEKKTPYFDGRMVQSHYQLLNTLQMSKTEVEELLEPSLQYYELLKTDPTVVRHHIKYPSNMVFAPMSLQTKNDVVYKLLGLNHAFTKTKLYDAFVQDLTRAFIKNLRRGHVLIEGNYSVLLGNPVEMLQQAIGTFDGTSVLGVGHVHSTRFPYDTEILGSRSPHVCMGNILLTKNVACAEIDRYFCLTPEIICVNSIKDNLLQRLSGADYDSDTMLITNHHLLIKAAKRHYDYFKVPTNLVEARKTKRHYTFAQQADLDIKTSVNLIGEIVNLSQELNSIFWHKLNTGTPIHELESLYHDICQLDVMSGLEIDSAKKELAISNKVELNRIQERHIARDKDGRLIKPNFFAHLAKDKGFYDPGKKNYQAHKTTMDYLQQIIRARIAAQPRRKDQKFVRFDQILDRRYYNTQKVKYDQARRVIELVQSAMNEMRLTYAAPFGIGAKPTSEQLYEIQLMLEACAQYIGRLRFSYSTMVYLLMCLERRDYKKVSRHLFNMLFGYPNTSFYSAIQVSADDVATLVEVNASEDHDICAYGYCFKIKMVRREPIASIE